MPSWGNRKVTSITPACVDVLLEQVAAGEFTRRRDPAGNRKRTPVRANRTGELIRSMYNRAIKWSLATENPAKDLYRREEQMREEFLRPEQLAALSGVLTDWPDQRAAMIISISVYTGARFSEAAGAQFNEFDIPNGIWTKPASRTKQGRVHRIPIAPEVVQIVKRRAELNPHSRYLFPGKATDAQGRHVDKPVTCIKRNWRAIKHAAHLPAALRLHDLRHSFAATLASNGTSLHIIATLLGHSQIQSTKRYAHLHHKPLINSFKIACVRVQLNPVTGESASIGTRGPEIHPMGVNRSNHEVFHRKAQKKSDSMAHAS